MKIFAIRDEQETPKKDLAYLFYHEKSKKFYIELPDDANEWDTPLLLSSFAARRKHTINSFWSLKWVQQRIIPPERQNIRQILMENGLKEYDEYKLLRLAKGRCAQDSYRITPIEETALPKTIRERLSWRIEDVIPLDDNNLLIFFLNGQTRKIDLRQIVGEDRLFAPVLEQEHIFRGVNVTTAGFAICWGSSLELTYADLMHHGQVVPLTRKDFLNFVDFRIVTTSQATDILDCTRQNINHMVEKKKLKFIPKDEKVRLYLMQDLLNA